MIVLPQALRTVFPAVVNQFISAKGFVVGFGDGFGDHLSRQSVCTQRQQIYGDVSAGGASVGAPIISEWGNAAFEARFAEADRR